MKYILDYEEYKYLKNNNEPLNEGPMWDRIKGHFKRHAGKYILGGAALTGIGAFALPFGLLAGHLNDKHPND